jgi:hypothetical protein
MKKAFQKINILNDEYFVYVCVLKKEKANKHIRQYLNIENKDPIGFNLRGITFLQEGKAPVIWIDPKLKGTQFYATLAHESIHATLHYMKYLGMTPLDESGDEFLAHSVSAIIRQYK